VKGGDGAFPVGPGRGPRPDEGGAARVFERIARGARAWMKTPEGDGLGRLERLARAATASVPDPRRADWEKLVSGFASAEDEGKRRARVEGLLRACRLFARGERDRERRATPLGWDDPVDRAEGVGPAVRAKLAEHGVACVADLVWTLPVAWDDLRTPVGVAEALERARACAETLTPAPRQCVRGVVKSASLVPMRGRRAVRVVIEDEGGGSGTIDAWWFFAAHGVLSVAQRGAAVLVVGRVRVREGKRAIAAHPDLVRDEPGVRGVRPRYACGGVPSGTLRRAIADALPRTSPRPDPVPREIAVREGMPEVGPLLDAAHGASAGHTGAPGASDLVGGAAEQTPPEARRALVERLAWVEAFVRVWQRMLAESSWGDARAPVLARDGGAVARLEDALGFALTAAQRRAIDAVARDLDSRVPMRRLLMGDVGTGKTAVALAAAAQCVAAGWQCALLAPTGVLAEQYADAAGVIERALGTRVVRIAAGMRAAERRTALAAATSGEAGLVVGTHALLEADVQLARLGLVIVDEQQRLGVAQRLSLVHKGRRDAGAGAGTDSDGERARATPGDARPHLLSLSATPIPRTLALALRGELATSVLDERPCGRVPVETTVLPRAAIADVVQRARETCARGERVFFVCPRIDDDDDEDDEEQLGAVARAARLGSELAPAAVVVVHGAMPLDERVRAMRAFRRGDAQVLVGTTVVEVGVDVPEATLMVVDGAERFGLAQLHQLRGRVGRGARPGRCVLLHEEPLGDLAARRLETLARTPDGADIARADLALRGAGDLGGTRQSGDALDFAWLDPSDPPRWIERIETDARAILARDARLTAPEHRALSLAVRRFAVQLAVREEAG
jgi:ATP-dependent DNA helicase RecG